MAGVRAAAKAATRQKVVAAAEHLFGSKPYEEVGIRDVAAKAGMSTGAVFANFDGKESLYEAAMGWKPPTADNLAAFLAGVERYLPDGPRQQALRLRLSLIGARR